MARLTGKNGKATEAGSIIASLNMWDLDAKVPTVDLTAMGDTSKQKGSVIRDWSGSIGGHWDPSDAPTVNIFSSGYAAATVGSGPTGGSVVFVFYPDAAGGHYWTGTAFIEDFAMKVGADKSVDWTAKLTGTGDLVYT